MVLAIALIAGSVGFLFSPRHLLGGWPGAVAAAFVGGIVVGWGYGLLDRAPTVIEVGEVDFMLTFVGAFLAAFFVVPRFQKTS